MSEPLSTDPYKGVRDFYPADRARREALFARIRQTLALWGYEEYDASPLERSELYEAKTSEEIVNEQTYTFTDRGDRSVTLRPEMTPTLARMVAARRRELAFPLRWFSIGNRFRYERPQKGRLREFYQADIDLVGLPEGEADVEIVRLASAILKAFGAKEKDFVIRVNSRKLFEVLAAINKWDEPLLRPETQRRLLRLVDAKSKIPESEFRERLKALGFPTNMFSPGYFSDDVKKQLGIDVLLDRLSAAGIKNAVWDQSITRGFDYYTGMVFEVYDTNSANPRALFGGGRYDGLVTLFGSEPVPAVGFALGDVTLTDFLDTHSLMPDGNEHVPQLYLGTPQATDIPAAQACADTLRETGARVFVNLTTRALGDQVKDAVKRGIPFFAAYGADEVAKKTVRLKTLATGEETVIPLNDLSARLREN